MIEITKFDEKYTQQLKKMMRDENLEFNEISLCLETLYIVIERNEILGFGYFNLYDEKVYIDHLYIKRSERMNKLGDSLFRAILNVLNILLIETVYMRNSGLYKAFLESENIEFDPTTDEFIIRLPDFFNRKCRGSKLIENPIN